MLSQTPSKSLRGLTSTRLRREARAAVAQYLHMLAGAVMNEWLISLSGRYQLREPSRWGEAWLHRVDGMVISIAITQLVCLDVSPLIGCSLASVVGIVWLPVLWIVNSLNTLLMLWLSGCPSFWHWISWCLHMHGGKEAYFSPLKCFLYSNFSLGWAPLLNPLTTWFYCCA